MEGRVVPLEGFEMEPNVTTGLFWTGCVQALFSGLFFFAASIMGPPTVVNGFFPGETLPTYPTGVILK